MKKGILLIFLGISLLAFIVAGCKKNEGYTVTQDSISSLPEITAHDIDGNLYHGVYIGSQIWMVENLNVTRFRDGTPIDVVTDQVLWTGMSDTMPLCCNYNNDDYLGNIYGKLYNRNVVFNSSQIAPAGWRLPTISDWDTLLTYLGGSSVAGNLLREDGTDHWLGPNTSQNTIGFTALPGGFRTGSGFTNLSTKGRFWSLWPYNSYTIDGSGIVLCDSTNASYAGFSIRCIKE